MLSKEEIENKIKPIGEMLQDKINRLSEENFRQSQYIEQLETDKQKLIEKLKEDIKNANNNIKHMEEKSILQTIARELAIGMRDYAQEILEIVKGVENG